MIYLTIYQMKKIHLEFINNLQRYFTALGGVVVDSNPAVRLYFNPIAYLYVLDGWPILASFIYP